MSMKTPEWVFFDMGGTLFDETAAWDSLISRTAEENYIPVERLREEMERAASQNLPEYATVMKKLRLSRREPWDSTGERLNEGADELLNSLCGKCRLGIIDNQPYDARERLGRQGILKYFDLIIISEELSFRKPERLMFVEALFKAKAEPKNCIMVGNELVNDIAPAKALGMGTIWVKREFGGMNAVTDESLRPDYTVENLLQAAELFAD